MVIGLSAPHHQQTRDFFLTFTSQPSLDFPTAEHTSPKSLVLILTPVALSQGGYRGRERLSAQHRHVCHPLGLYWRHQQRSAPLLPPRRDSHVHRSEEQALQGGHFAGIETTTKLFFISGCRCVRPLSYQYILSCLRPAVLKAVRRERSQASCYLGGARRVIRPLLYVIPFLTLLSGFLPICRKTGRRPPRVTPFSTPIWSSRALCVALLSVKQFIS